MKQNTRAHQDAAPPDTSSKARIRQAALELLAERGERGTTLRAVAKRANVSLGMVQHQFKSKLRLLGDVQAWVSEQLTEVTSTASTDGPRATDQPTVDAFLAGNPVIAAYLRRKLLEEAYAQSLSWAFDALRDRPRDAGADTSNSKDPAVVATMADLLAVSPTLLEPLLEHALDCGPDELRTRWRAAEDRLLGVAFNI